MPYLILITSEAIYDIQNAINYYDDQQIGLGESFENVINKQLLSLEKNPFYKVMYDDVRCILIKKFPYMIHYVIDEENMIITVYAVLHTSKKPLN